MKFEELKKLNIIFIPKETPNRGHTSDCMGLATLLTEKGHRVVVVVSHKDQVLVGEPDETPAKDGTQGESSTAAEPSKDEQATPKECVEIVDLNQEQIKKVQVEVYDRLSSLFEWNRVLMINWISFLNDTLIEFKKSFFALSDRSRQLERLIDKYKPDIFVTDGPLEYDTIQKTGKPWVWLFSGNPLRILNDKSLPPPYTGLPANLNSNKLGSIPSFVVRVLTSNLYKLFLVSKRVLNLGLMARHQPFQLITHGSPYLNIYGYPAELNYENSTEWKSNFYRVDTFLPKRQLQKECLKIPEDKAPKNAEKKKMILVTMGAFHSGNVRFMKRLLNNLSNSSHNFLISKEFSPEEYKLPENAISFDPSLTQSQLIEASDLVITDGTDHSVLTSFCLGKPMIVIPFWLAQLDNAQRIHETGYGIRLSPWSYTKQDILGAIELLLNDKQLKDRLRTASLRIIKEDRLSKAVQLIENLGLDKDFYKEE